MEIQLTSEQEKLVKQLIPSRRELEEIFHQLYKDDIFDDLGDVYSQKFAFYDGMKYLRSQDLLNNQNLTESSTILTLSKGITELEKQLKELQKLLREKENYYINALNAELKKRMDIVNS